MNQILEESLHRAKAVTERHLLRNLNSEHPTYEDEEIRGILNGYREALCSGTKNLWHSLETIACLLEEHLSDNPHQTCSKQKRQIKTETNETKHFRQKSV